MKAFEQLTALFEKYPNYLNEQSISGRKIIATICPHTPRELLYAAGATPLPLTLSHAIGKPQFVQEAEADLYLDTCPLPKGFYGALMKKALPEPDLIITACTCDHRLKTAEILHYKGYRSLFLGVPRTEAENAFEYFLGELRRIKPEIEDLCQKEITNEDLRKQVKAQNKVRLVFDRILYELKTKSYSIPKLFRFMVGTAIFYPDEVLPTLETLLKELEDSEPVSDNAPRILSLGSMPFDPGSYYSFLEDNCHLVMADLFRIPRRPVAEDGDILENLARANFSIECECHSPNANRIDTIRKVIKDYSIEGVIYHILKPCQTFGLGGFKIMQLLQESGIPTLTLDIDYLMENTGQMQTRIEAFLERIS
jgi:benzoyl-CoA reductase/2-hydroxyglutaryl-CoA dehydratase subunit BcrC/BadD/HgdB